MNATAAGGEHTLAVPSWICFQPCSEKWIMIIQPTITHTSSRRCARSRRFRGKSAGGSRSRGSPCRVFIIENRTSIHICLLVLYICSHTISYTCSPGCTCICILLRKDATPHRFMMAMQHIALDLVVNCILYLQIAGPASCTIPSCHEFESIWGFQ